MIWATMRIIRYTQPSSRSYATTPGFGGSASRPGFGTELDWLFGTALTGFAGTARNGQFPVDLYEDKDNTYVRAELPGVARDAIKVEIVDNALSIEASRKEKSDEDTVKFNRVVSIPEEVQFDKVTSTFENGVLTVTLPKKEEAKPRKISVSVN
jgi:HSP20 family protein